MADPKIVFCSNNHIYDEAIYEECPYCSKIAESQRALNKLVSNLKSTKSEADVSDEHTELLRVGDTISEEESDEHTELLFVQEGEKTASEEYTELLKEEVKDEISPCATAYVIGWLVCKDGTDKGRSFEIVEGKNYIIKNETGILITPFIDKQEQEIGKIYKDLDSGDFIFESVNEGHNIMNNGNLYGRKIIRPYDTVVLAGNNYLFVELITEFIEWGN